MIPLFHLVDTLMQTTEEMRDTLDRCGAVVIPDNEPEAQYTGWGQESVPALLKPLLSGPKVDLKMWTAEDLKLDDLDLSDEAKAVIRGRCKEIIDHNTKQAHNSLGLLGGAFGRVYNLHRANINATSDGLKVFFRCYSVNESNVRKLVRTKVLSIFKPSFRWVIASGVLESSVGIFGGSEAVINRITERKKVEQVLRGAIMPA